MTDVRQQVQKLEAQTKQDLKDCLEAELGDSYEREITNSLRNDLLRACYNEIEPDRSPDDQLKDHPEYSPSWQSWGTKRKLATALRLALTEHVHRPQSQGLTSLDKQALTELIVAVRITNSCGESSSNGNEVDRVNSVEMTQPPARATPPECPFEDTLPANQFGSYELYTWMAANREETDGEHGVYVLDCTPPTREQEQARMASLRQQAYKKAQADETLSKREQAAQAVTNGERLYYVGYASDVPVRVRQHINGRAAGGANFTNMFKPISLVEVSWYETETTARTHEQRRAEELTVPGESFGYWE